MDHARVEFFWDVASPYTYLAATQLGALAGRTGVWIDWRPFLLGGVFRATGNHAPATIPAKWAYLRADLVRWAAYYRIPFHVPELFPLRSVLPQRLACAALGDGNEPSRLPLALMHAYWVEGRDLSQADELSKVCASLGLDAPALLAAAEQPTAKGLLRANSDEAVRRGAFGAPALFVGEHLFWGNDRLELLEACLDGRISP
ncbi:MAG: 2-hydroxychromene-2-carboxylate isomerase [Rhodanobacteraceae bacterium]